MNTKTDEVDIDNVSLVDLRNLLTEFRLLIAGGTIVGAGILLAISFLLTPQYRVEVIMSPVEYSGGGGSLAQMGGAIGSLGALAGIGLGDDSSRNESIAILDSRSLTNAFITEHGLLKTFFAADWDEQQNSWIPTDPNDIPSLEDGYRKFDKDIRNVVLDRETGLVRLTITWSDRHLAASWANTLVERTNSVIQDRAVAEYQESIDYLNAELEKTTVVGVRQAIFSVIQSQIEQVMLATVRDDYAFKVLDPAVPPDADDTAFPNRPLFALIGLVVGFSISTALAFAIHSRRKPGSV